MESTPTIHRKYKISRIVDADVNAFEKSLLEQSRGRPYDPEAPLQVELSLFQSAKWYQRSTEDFRIIQVWGEDDLPKSQLVALITRPRGVSWFAQAIVPWFSCTSVSHEDEFWLLKNLPKILGQSDHVIKIHLHAYRPDYFDLADFGCLAQRAGYRPAASRRASRTAVLDLKPELADIMAAFEKKTSAKFRHPGLTSVDIRILDDPKWIPALQQALNASFSRTVDQGSQFAFETALKVARDCPDQVHVVGLFFKEKPEQLLAYNVVVRHGRVAETLSSGSLPDPALRKMPFNYFLHGDAIRWARQHGMELLDLGGITDGGDSDPLAGISWFKRRLTRTEQDIGRELEIEVAPIRLTIFNLLNRLIGLFKPVK